MTPPLTVLAPVAGTVVAMADVPDPVFAGEIVGPGLAIDPSRDGVVVVVSPIAGTVAKLHPHAFVIQSDSRRGALVHLGLDTVQLGGEGFTLHAHEGDTVDAGDDIISWDPGQVEAGGRSPICPVVALQGQPGDVSPLAEVGSAVDAGDPLLEWR
jgi:glucose-specific phosphotransferase system IIA component